MRPDAGGGEETVIRGGDAAEWPRSAVLLMRIREGGAYIPDSEMFDSVAEAAEAGAAAIGSEYDGFLAVPVPASETYVNPGTRATVVGAGPRRVIRKIHGRPVAWWRDELRARIPGVGDRIPAKEFVDARIVRQAVVVAAKTGWPEFRVYVAKVPGVQGPGTTFFERVAA